MMDRDTIAETLHQVCEECDKLLVEAGRKYRRALLLDKYDVRSLYNWGLALCFRAQLFSGGGENTKGRKHVLNAMETMLKVIATQRTEIYGWNEQFVVYLSSASGIGLFQAQYGWNEQSVVYLSSVSGVGLFQAVLN
ncbi:hypothetical protein SUGI_1197460 [Cryptomeria japonica]|nr:hypothetical protein SUGI_1197460 [Cryptomeria japonica]